MEVAPAVLCLFILLAQTDESQAQNPFRYISDFARGALAMKRAFFDMRKADWRNSDKYFHARGNYDAAKYGTGGRDAAAALSDVREWWQRDVRGGDPADSAADQVANLWGRNGGDPNKYRPRGLPNRY